MKDSHIKKTKDLNPNNIKEPINNNILLGTNGVPYYNNINIFANNMNNFKTNEINLKQYLYNKVNRAKNANKLNDTHGRSSSSIAHL